MKLRGRNLAPNMRGGDIGLLQSELKQLKLQTAIADTDGFFGSTTFLAVQEFQRTHNLTVTGIVDERTARMINRAVDASPRETWVIKGSVLQPDSDPVPKTRVRAFEKSLRSEKLLGEAFADGRGQYGINYPVPESTTMSLIVRAFDARDNELAASSVICKVSPVEVVNLVIGTEPLRSPSEFKQLTELVLPLLREEKVAIANLSESDVSFLACQNDINAEHLAYLVVSERLMQETRLNSEWFYALVRQSLPTNLIALVAQSLEILRNALESSIRDNIVGIHVKKAIPEILSGLQQQIVRLALRPSEPDRPTLGTLLDIAGIQSTLKERIASDYLKREGSVEEYWTQLRKQSDIGDKVVDSMQYVIRLATVTLNHEPLVRELIRMRDRSELGSELRDLARFNRQDWQILINRDTGDGKRVGAPIFLGREEKQRSQLYAQFIERMVEVIFPTTALRYRLAELDSERFASTINFLQRNPDFDFTSMRLHEYLLEKPNAIAGDIAQTTEQLKAVQRMMNIAPAFNKIAAVRLIANNIQSALTIRRMGAPQFLRVHANQFDDQIVAQQFYSNAARQADTALLISSMTYAFNPTHITITAPHLFGEGIPDLEDLFGSLDLCQCEQCGSVYSPSAYLVDILHFLMNRPANSPNRTALDVLFGDSSDPRQRRRADIGHIELTCQNTNTMLPYVDLVNEILERIVAPGFSNEISFQTGNEADILAANPEHLNVNAYNILAQAIFPWTLPFDLWAAEARHYLGQIGIQRFALMEAFISANAAEFTPDIATEYLGLTPREREIITDTAVAISSVSDYWGMETAEFNAFLASGRVSIALKQSGLSYEELVATLDVNLVNRPSLPAMRIQFAGADCNLDTATITNLTTARLSRFHRFVRLQRKLGWPVWELGMLLEILQVDELDNDALLSLAQAERIRKALKPSWEVLLTWWAGHIDTQSRENQPSRYDRIFNDPTINPPIVEIFELNNNRSELSDTNLRISDHVDAISRAIGIHFEDLNLLMNAADELPNDDLNLANLTRIYNVVTFAWALKISTHEYLIMRALTGLNPLGIGRIAQAHRFIQLVQQVRESGISFTVLDYLLRHQITPAPAIPTEAKIGDFLAKLQSELLKIVADHGVDSDPSGARVTELLASVLPAEISNRVVALLDGSTIEEENALTALINENLVQFLDANDAIAQLINPGMLATPEARFNYVLERLLPFLVRNASEALIIESLATTLSMPTEVADELLRRLIHAPDDPQLSSLNVFLSNEFLADVDPLFTNQRLTFHRLAKTAILLNALMIPTDQVEFVVHRAPEIGWLDIADLPLEAQNTASLLFERWLQQITLFRVASSSVTGVAGLLELLFLLDDPALTRETFLNRIATYTSWREPDIVFLTGPQGFDIDFPSGFVDGQFLPVLKRCFEFLTAMNVTAQAAKRWTAPVVNNEIARAIKQAIRAQYPEQQQWLAVAKPIRDELRDRQRAALVEYLVHEVRIQMPQLRVGNPALFFQPSPPGSPIPPNMIGPAVKELQQKLNASGVLTQSLQINGYFNPATRNALLLFQAANALPANGITTEATWVALDRIHQKLRGPEDLYAHFLIDVEMTSCMLTSRVVQATQSVRLFIQRCLLNLEPEVDLTPEDAKEWAWMKNYRVWEANRKVFLYPENWIEPELRDDKTPFFKQLESGLLQDEVNDTTVEREYLKYLNELDRVAQLEISGLYRQWETDRDILHVIGRTRSTPHLYYYRRWIDRRYWTPWEKVDVDIEGDHLVPVIWNRRLYLFWPMFMEKAVEEVEDSETPNRYYEIRMAWSEYREGKWHPKQVSKKFIETPQQQEMPIHKALFSFWSYLLEDGSLVVASEIRRPNHAPSSLLQFIFHTCNKDPDISKYFYHVLKPYQRTHPYFNTLQENPSPAGEAGVAQSASPFLTITSGQINSTNLKIELVNANESEVLGDTPGTFVVIYPQHERPYICRSPFFYQDNARTFFVVPYGGYSNESGGFGAVNDLQVSINPTHDSVPMELPDNLVGFLRIFLDRNANSPLNQLSDNTLVSTNRPLPGTARATTPVNTDDAPSATRSITTIMDATAPVHAGFFPMHWEARFFRFDNFYHPYVCLLIEQLNRHGIEGILRPDPEKESAGPKQKLVQNLHRQQLKETFFYNDYEPTKIVSNILGVSSLSPLTENEKKAAGPLDEFDFSFGGAYSIYNWELFFHSPFLIAKRLSTNRRFAEAQHWFHYLFDPTYTPSSGNQQWPERVWQIKPLFEQGVGKSIQRTMLLLKSSGLTKKEQEERSKLRIQIDEWRKNPFNPHLIARLRPEAYMKATVMAYLDNLIAWADDLFRQDNRESINEAIQLYILASNILGERPTEIAAHADARKTMNGQIINTFNQLRPHLDSFSNMLTTLEERIYPMDTDTGGNSVGSLLGATHLSLNTNDDSPAADLPLAAPGIELSNEEQGTRDLPLAAPVPAILGPTLFFCIPKNDQLLQYWDTVADRLFKIRHCMNIEGIERQLALFSPPIDPALLVRAVAAGLDLGSVLSNLNAPNPTYRFQALAQKTNELISDVKSLGSALLSALEKRDGEELAALRSGHEIQVLNAIRETKLMQIEEAKTSKQTLDASLVTVKNRKQFYESREKISDKEQQHMDQLEVALGFQRESQSIDITRAAFGYLPDFDIGIEGFSSSPTVKGRWGSSNILSYMSALSQSAAMFAHMATYDANKALTEAGYDRRKEDWDFQAAQAANEISQLEKQIAAAEIRMSIAEQDLKNHDLQIEHARTVDEFMRNKFTNTELYHWMIGQISAVYFQSYQLAYDLAKRAERAFSHELGLQDSNFIQFGYWDGLKKGLLAGEKLQHDLRRMEVAYLEQNKREYELTKHVSLRQLNPLALLQLKATGSCDVTLPEWLFDLDCPGHYMRRLKTVSITIPCIVGPYANVNCLLTLQRSTVRISPQLGGDNYPREGEDSLRFVDYFGAIQSVVTSGATNDSGMFETNLRDERFLPFEGSGAESTWRLELPGEFRQFDYSTISDVVMHIHYTARQGGNQLRATAVSNLQTIFETVNTAGLALLLSLKQDFPTEWHRFVTETEPLVIVLGRHHFSYLTQGHDIQVQAVHLVNLTDNQAPVETLLSPENLGLQLLPILSSTSPDEEIVFTVSNEALLPRNSQTNAFLVIRYTIS